MNSKNDEVLNDNTEENTQKNNDSAEIKTENSAETANTDSHTDISLVNEEKIHELEGKVAEANDKYLRLYSEFDNFRKRTSKEKVDLMKTSGEEFFKAFLPVIDDFERAMKANENATDVKALAEGVQLIYSKFKGALTQKGLEVMETMGKPFDSDIMEAITSIPAPSDDMKGKVVDEIEKGYSLNGKVIRFAKVVTGS